MSRSYKKTPWCGDNKGTAKKRAAWKKVRQWLKDNPDVSLKDGNYKKIYETWDICDWQDISTFEEYYSSIKQFWYTWRWKYEDFPDRQKSYNEWRKYYLRK